MKLPKPAVSSTTRIGLAYFVLAVALTMLVNFTAQYMMRQGANDPQIQMARDVAAALDSGQAPAELVATRTVNMRTSLAPFVIVTDANRKVLAATGTLDGKQVIPPAGAFTAAAAAANHENRVTWQPAAGVRQATVVVARNGGYVLAARNLSEVEAREVQVQKMASATLVALLLIGLALVLIPSPRAGH